MYNDKLKFWRMKCLYIQMSADNIYIDFRKKQLRSHFKKKSVQYQQLKTPEET